jgi:hypothetical protein
MRSVRAKTLEQRFSVMRDIGRIITPEYRFKWPHLDWWANKEFSEYLCLFDEFEGNNADRRWTLWQLMGLVDNLDGDTVECGVYQGAGSYLICRRNALLSTMRRTHYLCDSFEGISNPGAEDGSFWQPGSMACDEQTVGQNLSEFAASTVYVKGWIPDSFRTFPCERPFCFVHIDVDLYQPTLESLRFFYPRLQQGGVLLCDDYGFSTCPGATQAMDEYFADKPEKVLALCAGGGFIVQGCSSNKPGRAF